MATAKKSIIESVGGAKSERNVFSSELFRQKLDLAALSNDFESGQQQIGELNLVSAGRGKLFSDVWGGVQKGFDVDAVDEEVLDKKILFKDKVLDELDARLSSNQKRYLYELVAFDVDGQKLNRREMLERVRKVNELVDRYQLNDLTDVFDLKNEEIVAFCKDLAGITGRDWNVLFKRIYDFKRDELEVSKTKKFISDDQVLEQMLANVERGEEVDFAKVEEAHGELVRDENTKIAALDKTYHEIDVYIQQEKELKLKQGPEELSDVLSKAEVDHERFVAITDFVKPYLTDVTRFSYEDGHLTFSLTARDGVDVPVRVDGNTLVLKDEKGEVDVPIGQNLRLDREVEVFWVRAVLKKKEEDGEVVIKPEFRDFLYSRDLAKLVSDIAKYRVEIGGQELEHRLEVEEVYDYVLSLDVYDLMLLQDEIQSTNGDDAALEALAEKRQKEIA